MVIVVNKMFLTMPKSVVQMYLRNHYMELTEEEGLYLLKKGLDFPDSYYQGNYSLRNSSKILEFVLGSDIKKLEYFDSLAFSEAIIDKIVASDYIPSISLVRRVPKLLANDKLKFKIVEKYPSMEIISLLSKEQFNENILSILEKNENFIPEISDIVDYPIFEKSLVLIKRAIKDNPEVLLYLSKIDESLIDSETLNGLNLDLNMLRERKELRDNPQLMYLALAKDPNAIALFNQNIINNNLIKLAISRGYIPKDEDFQENPFLGELELIMELALTINPQLIRYLKTKRLSPLLVEKALKEYEVTEEDLKANPYLGNFSLIMENLVKKNSQLEMYSYLDPDKKKELIKSCLLEGRIDKLTDLPFLKNKISPPNIKKLVEALSIKIDEDDMNLQERYFRTLNSVIDGVINIRYHKNKPLFQFPSINVIDEKVKSFFKAATEKNDLQKLDELINNLYTFVNGYYVSVEYVTEDYLRKNIYELYQQYLLNRDLSHEKTLDFYNEILNEHREKYKKDKKDEIISDLLTKISLTAKKQMAIITGRKLKKFDTLMESSQYEQLGTTKEELLAMVQGLRNYLNSMKKLKKGNIQFTDESFRALEEAFIKGRLNEDFVKATLEIDDAKMLRLIIDEYNQIKMAFLDKIPLFAEESEVSLQERENLGFNYNNFLIGDQDRYLENLTKLINSLYDEQARDILDNTPSFGEILDIIPFADLFPEFQTNDLISILSQYSRAKERILEIEGKTNQSDDEALNTIFLRFDYLIKIANGYASSDDIQTITLGNRVINKVHVSSSKRYFDFYLKLLDRIKGQIPPVSLVIDNWRLESGNYHDQERLLIGKNCYSSCVDLGDEAGGKTYQKCLIEDDGDVLIVRSNQTNSFLARALMFRKGNIVMLAPIIEGSKFNIHLCNELYNRTLLDKVGRQIIDQAKTSNDNIDFVFITRTVEELDYLKYKVVKSEKLMSEFPYSDLKTSAYLIASRDESKARNFSVANIHYDEAPKALYLKPRKPIKWNENIDENELSRIRALRIIKEEDSEARDEEARNFEQFFKEGYSQVISGEDWYIAIKKDGTSEEVLVPSKDERSRIEFEEAKEKLRNMNLITPSEKISK